jgi:hypothetical protein
MSSETPITLFCPECSHPLSGPSSSFATPRVCPGCQHNVQFVDYAREKIAIPSEPKRKPSITWADQALRGLVIATALLAFVAVVALWTGSSNIALWCGVAALAAALPLATRYGYLHRELLRAEERVKRTERALVVSKAKLEAADQLNRGFQKNIEKVAAEERRRVQAQMAGQARKLEEKKEDADWRMRRADDQFRVVRALGERILNDAVERISHELTARNFDASRRRLQEVIEFCRENDYPISPRREEDLVAQLAHRYNQELRIEQERQRRDAISARLQAEQRAHEQMEVEITRAEAQRSAIRRKLTEAEAASETAESGRAILTRLRSELHVVEQKTRDATALAQHAKAGHVVVASNVGSFGEGVLKIFLSRRIDPMEEIRDLARESAPFPYDVHMVVSSERASELLHTLQDALHQDRLNRIDLGKNFFRTDVETVWRLIVANHGAVECTRVAAAEEFRESEAMTSAQFQHVTQMMRSRENWSAGMGND